MSVSIASFMCRCRTETQTGSSSSRSASFSSVPPIVLVYLYLRISACQPDLTWELYEDSPIVNAVFDRQEVVDHGLVPKFVEKRSNRIHRSVNDEEHGSWSSRSRLHRKVSSYS